ncbi:MAG TPA: Gfo/Idh/MocA family oxidoreductase [Firmicutes bacterium]|nr:MAG: hypothetical protein AA931_07800 [Peptococcaceae bacterium 1109]HHT73971.1 Gfo/Idh/MocA family oxidoreductase [Bacillota bacterium]
MDVPVKWGILGGAHIAHAQFVPGLADARNAVLYGVASRSKARAEELKAEWGAQRAYGSYEELLADPEIEAVYIPLPNNLHHEWTVKALQAKKHVLCEKPMALNVEQCREMLEVARAEGMIFMEAFMYRFHPQIFKVEELIQEGRIGEVKLIRGTFSFILEDETNIRMVQGLGGGSLMDVGCYPIHLSNLIYGELPVKVKATGVYRPEAPDVDLSMCGILEYSGGRMAVFDSSFVMEDRQMVEIVGTGGRIIINRPWRPDRAEVAIVVQNGPVREEIQFPSSNPYQLEVEHFSSCIRTGQSPLIPGEFGMGVVAVMEACHLSACSGECAAPRA